MKVLIIEDEDVLLRVLVEKFKEENFSVIAAKDGEEGLLMANKHKPDIILLDILLPKVGGINVLSFLKSDKDLSLIPVIILSNLGQDNMVKRALKLGAVDYMIKVGHPVNEVVDKVKKYVLFKDQG